MLSRGGSNESPLKDGIGLSCVNHESIIALAIVVGKDFFALSLISIKYLLSDPSFL